MATVLHHLSALGWGWTMVFLTIDCVAIACVTLALLRRQRATAFRCVMVSAVVALVSFGATYAAATSGLLRAFGATGSEADPSQKAAVLASGISEAMNGAAFGVLSAAVSGVATVVCLVVALTCQRSATTAGNKRPLRKE